ncbi:TPR-like protein [Setomelanomma holmii]|uniref:TPR-like protein n=1 Tax=Setomelanomma holmii TaxID=210430 RepID=A0A9P4H623_9PLEO|nr:TPR-like protein [Setomelanomma holmii]
MLERASTCFETGGRQLLRAPKQCLRTRRMLHSAFWHHGASDLSLPLWWAASTILDGGSGDVEDPAVNRIPTSAARPQEGPLLDFLYPTKTLALLKQLSVRASDTVVPRRRSHHGPYMRRYSTTQESLDAVLRDSPAAKALHDFLRRNEARKQDQAWQLYTAIPETVLARHGAWELRADLLEYLTTDDDTAVPNRVLQLFDELTPNRRRSSSYRAAIVAYIALRMVGPAVHLLEHVPAGQDIDFLHVGTDVVLRRTILDEQWEISLRVFTLFLAQTPSLSRPTHGTKPTSILIRWGDTIPEIWQGVRTLHDLQTHLRSFLEHVQEFQHELRSSVEKERALTLFITSFVPHILDQVLYERRQDERAVAKYVRKLFKELKSLGISMNTLYEHAIHRLINVPQHRAVAAVQRLWLDLYDELRRLCMDSQATTTQLKPSVHLLRNMVIHYGDRGDVARVQDFLKDLETFFIGHPMSPRFLTYLMNFYADRGDTARVQRYFEEFRSHYPDHVSLKVLSALPLAHARRADVEGTVAQFQRIEDEFDLAPDAACWNILLMAYVRADDLDGALECFNTCLHKDIAPDKYTFGTLLDLCAARGDVEAFEALFSKGKQMGVPLTQDVRARSGYVQAFLNAGDAEGAEAIAQGMLRSWKAGNLQGHALTHTWNLLIQHHALQSDIASARQRYKEMVDNNIPVDSWTYGSLMRALVEVKQSNAAYKILRKTMPQNNFRVHALHYAIVMTGLLREGGDQVALAVDAHEQMVKQGIAQTPFSQEASIRTLAAAKSQKTAKRGKRNASLQLEVVEDAVEGMVTAAVQGQVDHQQPRHGRLLDSRSFGTTPQNYYGLLVSLYAGQGAYKTCQRLLKKAEKMAPNVDNYTVPLTLITGAMEAHLAAKEHAELARCWDLARESAFKLSKTFHQAANPELPAPESNSLIDPAVRECYEESRISANRRNVLVKPARIYMRSLLDSTNPDPNALQAAQRTMRELLVHGYTCDAVTWNEFVTELAQRGHIVDAFSTCEEYLMPGFPGWRNLHPNYLRKDRQGYQWMELRHYEIKKTSLMPRYKTLVILAVEMRKIRNDEVNGIGYDTNAGAWRREMLEGIAPMTRRAIEAMPRTNDRLQTKHIHNVA